MAEAKNGPSASQMMGDMFGAGYDGLGGTRLQQRMDLAKSVGSAASAARLGDFFQYAIDKPVTLPRQKSAMLPIVGKNIESSASASTTSRSRPSSRSWASS